MSILSDREITRLVLVNQRSSEYTRRGYTMHISLLTTMVWQMFATQFPDAVSWLLARLLQREMESLRQVAGPTPWQQGRLAELEAHHVLQQRCADGRVWQSEDGHYVTMDELVIERMAQQATITYHDHLKRSVDMPSPTPITLHQQTVAERTATPADAPLSPCSLCVSLITLPALRQCLQQRCQCGEPAGTHAVRHPHPYRLVQCAGFMFPRSA
jgi:hypothetical protein